ncbi:MAG: glycosyltransferase [Syntrophorhabdales bacterium]|jgi:GT2 family glycosyltransferase
MILAILVLYKQKLDQSKTFLSLFGSLSRIEDIFLFVYDNSPIPMHDLAEFASYSTTIQYLSDKSNPGVSKAYNTGARLAQSLKKQYILLLDQDTVFPKDAISGYVEAIKAHEDCALFAPVLECDGQIFSPCWHGFNIYLPLRNVLPGRVSTKNRSLLNSGMCIRLDAFDKAGGFDEKIPLDFADHDFMKRYRTHFDSFFLLDMACEHGFSDKENLDAGKALTRFGYYCQGARHSIKGVADAFSLAPVSFLRAARLSARFRTLRFFRLLFRTFLRN